MSLDYIEYETPRTASAGGFMPPPDDPLIEWDEIKWHILLYAKQYVLANPHDVLNKLEYKRLLREYCNRHRD